MELGVLAKDTHGQTIRFAPPLMITKKQIDWIMARVEKVLAT
jgi:ornithine--oxo-acid transaminase